ncbi:MAG: OmpA family protein [Bacteroidales bacterium]
MKKLVITLALLLTAGSMLVAQEVEKGSKQRWRNFETNKFWDNWEITLGAGFQTYYITDWQEGNFDTYNPEGFGKDFTMPSFEISVGKWVTPITGFRLGGYGIMGKMTNYPNATPGMWVTNEYWAVHADVMVNLTNWICRYKSDRLFNLIAFVGLGYSESKPFEQGLKDKDGTELKNQTWGKEIVSPIGLIARFRLCEAWALNLELRDQVSRPAFDNRTDIHSKFMNGNLLSASLGVTYKFPGERNFHAYTPIDKSAYDNRISALERDLQTANDQNTEYQKQIDRYKKQLSDKERELQDALRKAANGGNSSVKLNDDVTLSIFFPIGSAEVSDKNEINIKYMADVIKASNKTFTITGYADNATGSENRNLELSQQRAEAVYNALINAGVDKSKIKVDYKGCSVQPFEKDYLNRVAIIK